MEKLNQFITQLKLNNSRDYKIGILKAWKSEIMNKDSIISLILRYVYSYDIQFYITSDSILKHWNDELQNIVCINSLPKLLDFLKETRGLCAVYSTIDFIKRHIEYKDLILSILDKKLNVGITETTINKVYPNFIKTFDVCLAQKYDSKSKIDENWIIERKLDGCFSYDTPILLADFTTKPIGEIVDNQLDIEVISYNINTHHFEPKRIINWFNNGKKKNWIKISNKNGYLGTFFGCNMQSKSYVTDNHKFFINNNYEEIKNINKINKCILSVNEYQKQVIYGSYLGDGCLQKEKRCTTKDQVRLTYSNSEKQLDYFNKKNEIFNNINTKISIDKKRKNSFGKQNQYTGHTKPLIFLSKLYNKISLEYILNNINLLGLAIWYMDDGHRMKDCSEMKTTNKYSRVQLGTYSFGLEGNKKIFEYFKSKGYGPIIRYEKRKKLYFIELNSIGSQKFFKDIAPYIPESMEYKIPINFRNKEKIEWWKNNQITLELYEKEIKKYPLKKYSGYAYDIEVEDNHNYIANGNLVHNCRTIVIKKDNQIKIYSRQGKEFTTLDKIKEDLLDLPENIVLDGEVCILDKDGNEDFQSIIRVIKRKDFTIKNPVLKVFDVLTLDEFETGKGNTVYTDRINRLSEWFKQHKTKTIQFVNYWNYTEDNFQMLKNIVTENNWEGLMLRKNIGYQNGRIKDLLKYKMFQSEEFTVIDTKEGVITIVENGISKQIKTLGSVIIKLDNDNTCDVGSGFTIEERNQFYNNPELIVGQQIEVKYFEKTVDKKGKLSLRFPVFKCLRPEII